MDFFFNKLKTRLVQRINIKGKHLTYSIPLPHSSKANEVYSYLQHKGGKPIPLEYFVLLIILYPKQLFPCIKKKLLLKLKH